MADVIAQQHQRLPLLENINIHFFFSRIKIYPIKIVSVSVNF